MYSLSWQHTCYTFDPSLPFETNEFGEWFIPIFPNGDYSFFLSKDLSNGIFGDGIHFKVSLWGVDILNLYKANAPKLLALSDMY